MVLQIRSCNNIFVAKRSSAVPPKPTRTDNDETPINISQTLMNQTAWCVCLSINWSSLLSCVYWQWNKSLLSWFRWRGIYIDLLQIGFKSESFSAQWVHSQGPLVQVLKYTQTLCAGLWSSVKKSQCHCNRKHCLATKIDHIKAWVSIDFDCLNYGGMICFL